jgi:hypothetical protein
MRPLKTFRGEFPALVPHPYASLIAPIAWIQAFFSQIYDFVIHLLWSHLIQGRRYQSLGAFMGALMFCGLSVLSYFLRDYDVWLLLGSIGLWLWERWMVNTQYGHPQHKTVIQLTCLPDAMLRWEWRSPSENLIEHFEFDRLREIEIAQHLIRGGSFEILLSRVWQVRLKLTDDRAFVIYQEESAARALQQGQGLADHFQLPLWFADSQGDGAYAIDSLDLHGLRSPKRFPSTIRIQSSSQQWKIISKWNLSSAWSLVSQIVQESGFLLFIIAIINLMIIFGKILYITLALAINLPLSDEMINMSDGLLAWLLKDFDWIEVGEYIFAIALMVLKGAELSREEHLYISPQRLQVFLDHQKLGDIPLPAIITCLLIQKPQPLVLIVGQQQAIEIPGLQREIEFRAMLLKLQEAIAHMRSAPLES